MAKNEFLTFGIAEGANVLSNEEYAALAARVNGFSAGVAKSRELNKAWRQSSIITHILADFIAKESGNDVLDNGNIDALKSNLALAIKNALPEVRDATISEKGITQLTDKTGNSNTLAATQKLVTDVNDNANTKLSKSQNGADIPDKNAFVKNLGLVETVNKANNAVSANGGNYQGTFTFSEIATIAKERNSVQLVSTNAGAPAGTLCSYMKANWYDNEIAVGAVRGGTVNLIGAGIDINSKRALTIYKNGIVVPADYGNFDARYDNIPAGVPLPYPHRYTPPGYLTCNGQTFDKSLYPKLAEAYPAGTVPDLRGEFIRGWDDSRGVDPGRVCGSWQSDAMQGHTHRAWQNATAASATDSPSQHGGQEYTGRITQTHVVSSPISDGVNGEPRIANETRPRNVAFNYIVRAA